MRFRRWLPAVGLLLFCPGITFSQATVDSDQTEADFRLVVEGTFDPQTLAEFRRRVDAYAAMRSRLEQGLPPLVVTLDADEIERFEHRLAQRIGRARGSERGQVFPPSMAGELRQMLVLKADAPTVAAIMEDGPGEFDIEINHTYSKKRPLATMPPNILLQLPDLPRDMEYRFVGRHLILRDVRANIIVDEIPYALTCDACVPRHDEDELKDPP